MHINIKLGFPSHSFVFWLVSTITITFPVSFDHPWLGNVGDQLCPEILYDALHLLHLPVEQVIFFVQELSTLHQLPLAWFSFSGDTLYTPRCFSFSFQHRHLQKKVGMLGRRLKMLVMEVMECLVMVGRCLMIVSQK